MDANPGGWKFFGDRRPPFAEPPAPGQESVWDYPRPPAVVADSRLVTVRSAGTVVATTRRALRVLETASPPTYYLPCDDVAVHLLQRRPGAKSYCEWKGEASYWSFGTAEAAVENAAWSYERPSPAFAALAGYFSFYPGKLECYVNEERVRAQAGGFYGGWVTDEIVGPFKGQQGTTAW